MNRRARTYVFLSSYTWATIGLFITGSLWFYLLTLAAFIYLLIGGKLGGKKHV
ncbi:MAG TPA: hypothetical protein PLJ98_09360 [Acholeplasmataceae bacterium]|jgi:hypothetical protein|nr:hypothetical protein [Acholeplasmataceae bacterium]HRX45855.1 hypothetical protein [Acholeplasmataceae bacterium]